MDRYKDFTKTMEALGVCCELTPVADDEIARLGAEQPGVPEDYVLFLRQIGWGDIGHGGYSIYSRPSEAHEIYPPETASGLTAMLIFGNDSLGYAGAFDRSNGWALVEIDPNFHSLLPFGAGFEEFMRDRVRLLAPR